MPKMRVLLLASSSSCRARVSQACGRGGLAVGCTAARPAAMCCSTSSGTYMHGARTWVRCTMAWQSAYVMYIEGAAVHAGVTKSV